ncbi:aldo/keto reductase [Streptomyces sp. NBC_00996]|uniref:aldo/keto reductase n=1 Tax=Streptomyces sp. NBC_00996 TaxID=2903710 RepID=UPI00386522FA|nr:aldo/keto reductase [Streptomyces sp. NBC_00996]
MRNAIEPIRKVELGTGGPLVGVQGLGAMGISAAYGQTDDAAARETLEATVEAGVTLIDTADMYGVGANEEFLAPFLAAHRDEITLATKFGIEYRADDPSYRAIRNDPAYIKSAVEASLRRLKVELIDFYYMHRRDPAIPLADSVGAMAELVREGKVKHLGLSGVTGAELREAHAVHPITALQTEWSLFSRDVEHSAVGAAAELGVAFVPYSPLGRGLSDELWALVEPLLPGPGPKLVEGRPWVPGRQALCGILFLLHTGVQGEYLPQELNRSGSDGGSGLSRVGWSRVA